MDETNEPELKTQTQNTAEQANSDITTPPAHLKLNANNQKHSRKVVIAVAIIVILLLSGAALWWFMLRDKARVDQTKTENTQVDTGIQEASNNLKPFAVAYAYGDAEKAGMEIFWRPIDGGDRTSAKNVGQMNYVNRSGVNKNHVFAITSPSSGSSDGEVIWYSSDSGRSYQKLVSLDLPEPDTIGDQITSAVFSSDGSRLVYGYLKSGAKGNIVREVDLASGKTTDLFTINTSGVFLKGYDITKKQIYYFSGCYNCDGVRNDKLFAMDLGTKKEAVLYDATGVFGMEHVFRDDYAKLLVLEGSETAEGMGGGAPYKLREFDLTDKTFKDLLTLESPDNVPQVGYRSPDNLPYYSDGQAVEVLLEDGTRSQIFAASKPIYKVLYVGLDTVISAVGSFDNYILSNYTISTKKTVEILNGDQSTALIGVTFE